MIDLVTAVQNRIFLVESMSNTKKIGKDDWSLVELMLPNTKVKVNEGDKLVLPTLLLPLPTCPPPK